MAEANWYVVHTYSGYENKVKANIEKTIENRHLEEEILEGAAPVPRARSTPISGDIKALNTLVISSFFSSPFTFITCTPCTPQ